VDYEVQLNIDGDHFVIERITANIEHASMTEADAATCGSTTPLEQSFSVRFLTEDQTDPEKTI
jgi:hypothetical protein